jgi:hypothetical protein
MKNLLVVARAAGASFALVLLGMVAMAANSAYWQNNTPSVTGPWLGDSTFNISTLYMAHARLAGVGYNPALSASQTSGQANCTQLNNDGLQQVSTSASTGYVCLPTAVSGKVVLIANAVSGQTIDIYSSATSYTSGTADTINGTAGTTAYTGLTTGKSAICFAANNGAWYCGSIS